MHMNVKDGDLVLEIGSGNNPNPRSDVLCDRYLRDNRERAGGFSIVIDRPFVVCDGYRLPFADKAFDYVICSHVFEHMDDPIAFAREVTRVAKAGSIEVPSAISERVFGWGFHHWYGELDKGILAFTRKREGEQFSGFFHRMIARSIWFRRFFEEHEGEWYTRLEWQGQIPLRVVARNLGTDQIKALDEGAWELLVNAKPETLFDLFFGIRFFLRRGRRKLVKTMRNVSWRLGKLANKCAVIELLTRLCVCPRCHGRLGIHGGKMECLACKMDFPMDGVIPILLLPQERKKGFR